MNKQAVIYARYSSDKQTEQSIEGQLRVCYEFAKAQGYDIQKEYIDRAMTGTNDNRPSFLQMINDAKNKDFQFIIVYKLDRFSRNTYDSTLYKHKLAQSGVKVISATEAISDTMEGKLIERILESMAEMYSVDLSQKVKRGMRESRLKKLSLGGYAPLGFKVVDKKLTINEEVAPHVKNIFEMYAKGVSQKEIIRYLTENRIKSNKNNIISYNSLYKIFKNKKYIGILEYDNDIIEDYCPAIVSVDLFDAVQRRLAENKQFSAKRKAQEKFILSGHLYCGYCGTSVIGDSATSKNGKKHSYYSCRARKNLHSHCELKSINKYLLEERVISQTTIELLNNKKDYVDRVFDLINETTNDYRISDYESKIKKVDKEIDDIVERFKNAKSQIVFDKLNQQADELNELKTLYEKELNKIKKLTKVKFTKKDISAFIDKLIDLGKSDNIDEREIFVNTCINVVYVFNDRTFIYLNNDNEINTQIPFEQMQNHKKTFFENKHLLNYYYDNNSNKCSDIFANGLPITKIFEHSKDATFIFWRHVTLLVLNHPNQ